MLMHEVVSGAHSIGQHALTPLLQPRSVALVGASRRRNSVGNDMLRNMEISGFAGDIYPVNPSYDQLYGLSYDFPRLPCDKGAAARHPKYAGQRRGTDREWVGRCGPCGSVIAPVFSHDLNG